VETTATEIKIQAELEGLEKVTAGFEKMGESAEHMGSRVEATTKRMEINYRGLITSFSGAATAGFALYNMYDRISEIQVVVDRANVTLKASMNAAEDAQRRYNIQVQKYGIHSAEARAAAADLRIAQERVEVAASRAQMVQENLNEAMVRMAIGIIPMAITMIDSMSKALTILKTTTILATAAEWGHIIALKAKSVAFAIMHALTGPAGWAILAAAAAFAAVGIGLAGEIPSRQHGGLIGETRPYLLHAGEYVIPKEKVEIFKELTEKIMTKEVDIYEKAAPLNFLSGLLASKLIGEGVTYNITLTIQNPVFRNRGDIEFLVDRLKRMGMA